MALDNTEYGKEKIDLWMQKSKNIHFIGVGGIHMSSLAILTAARGYRVTGSDRSEGEGVARVRAAGIPVTIGHSARDAENADLVVYTLALDAENPAVCAARARGVPLVSRADYLGWLMAAYPCRIGVAGSHGKSTVTAWLGEMLTAAGRDPTVLCGANVRAFGAPFRRGDGEVFLFEACEYGNSFLRTAPTVAVLLNVALDHVDFFADLAAITHSFAAFAALPGTGGRTVFCADDPAAVAAAEKSPADGVSFGLSEAAQVRAADVAFEGGFGRFRLLFEGRGAGEVVLRVPGEHNVRNALAVAAAARAAGLAEGEIAARLGAFCGAGRRMEYKGVFCGARVYDDYAHHPAEIAASLRAARLLADGGRVFAVFQSHTYSRTAAFFGEICAALAAADRVFVADIYPARETDTRGMSAALLAAGIGENAAYVGGFSAIAAALAAELAPTDLLLVMGAGDIGGLFREFSKKHFTL